MLDLGEYQSEESAEQARESCVRADFICHEDGSVRISFFDPAYVRAEAVLFDRTNSSAHVILHESAHFLGCVPEFMVPKMLSCDEAVLTATRPDGTVYELTAPIL